MKKNRNREVSLHSLLSLFKRYGNITTIIVFILIVFVYLITLLTLFPNLPITTSNAETIPNYVKVYPPFRVDEINYYTIAKNIIEREVYKENSIEKSFTIGFPLIAAPFVAVWDEQGGYIANMVIVWFSLFIFYLIAIRYVSHNKANLITILLAFTTLNWFYAVSCYTEPLSQFLILSGLYFLTWKKTSKWHSTALFCAGALISLNLFVRPHYVLIALPFFLFSWLERKEKFVFNNRAFWYAGGTVIVIVLWMLRNKIFFGSPLQFEYSRMVARLTGDTSGQQYSGNIFWGMHRLLFDQFHGLLTISPILMIFPAGLRIMWQRGMKNEVLTILVSVIIILVFIALSPYPYTDFGLGSRHMMPIIPLIFLPAIFFLDGSWFPRIIITLLAVYSFYHAGLGWFTGGAVYVGEKGIFAGLLHDSSSRAIILARKDLLPKKKFSSTEEVYDDFKDARLECDFMKFFQTLHPDVVETIKGNERSFMNFIRQYPHPESLVVAIDPEEGIMFKKFHFKMP